MNLSKWLPVLLEMFNSFWPMFQFYTPWKHQKTYTRKPLVFWCFQGVINGNIGQKWVNKNLHNVLCISFLQEDRKEGMAAFVEKRKADFKDKWIINQLQKAFLSGDEKMKGLIMWSNYALKKMFHGICKSILYSKYFLNDFLW